MSVSRLIFGIFWLVLGVLSFRGRGRVRALVIGERGWGRRMPTLLAGLGVLCILLGLLWIGLAFD